MMRKQKTYKQSIITIIKQLIIVFSFLSFVSAFSQKNDYLAARAFELRNQTDSAIKYYSILAESGKNDSKIFLARGRIYYLQHKYTDAINDYNKANKISQDVSDFGLAQCYAKTGDLKQSLYWLEKHLNSKYKLPQAKIRMDEAFAMYEDNAEWKKFWTNDWYNRNESEIGEARFMYNNKDWMELINYLNAILKTGSRRHEMLFYRSCAYFAMGSYQAALKDLNDAIEANKQNYLYYLDRARTLIQLKKEKEALNDLNSAISVSPEAFDLYLSRAGLNLNLKNYDAANLDVNLYLSYFQEDTAALYLSARILTAKGSYINALGTINKLISQNAKQISYLAVRAEIYEKTNLVTYALKDYNTCLSLDNSDIGSLKKRGRIFLMQGNKNDACTDFKKAMNLGDFEANNLYLDNCR